jgi:aspartyl-tRNA synthetase
VVLCGWVDKYRNLGGLLFLDIRDHTGLVQVVSSPATPAEAQKTAERVRQEWVVCISGVLRRREDVNTRKATGAVEVVLSSIDILNSVKGPLPFPISTADEQLPPRCEKTHPFFLKAEGRQGGVAFVHTR